MTEGERSSPEVAACILNCGIDGNEWLDLLFNFTHQQMHFINLI
jgi:hypothetical protein